MDANISMIPIKHEWKFSEQTLKRLATKDPQNPPECHSEYTDIKKILGVKFKVFLDIKMKNNVSFLSPRLQLSNLKDKIIRGTFAFYIKSANYASLFGSVLLKDGYGFTGPEICSFEDLFNPEKTFIVNGECCIEVKGVFHVKSSIEKCEPQLTLGHYFWNRDDQDFTIVVGKENESKTEIKVHKCVICARSSVFDAMLSTNMKEKAESKVEIIDFDVHTVKNAIAFCYDQKYGIPFIDITEATSLFQFSDKYDIKDLKNELQKYLLTVVVPNTICQIANASVNSNSPKLRDFCVQAMLMFSKTEIPVDNIEILDKDIANEVMKKIFSAK